MSDGKKDGAEFMKGGGLPEIAVATMDILAGGLPIASTILNLGKYGLYLHEKIFLAKLEGILAALLEGCKVKDDFGKFQNFIIKNRQNEQFHTNLLMLIDKMDRIEKSEIIANILLSMSRDDLSYGDGMRLMSMVDRVYFEDLEYLKNFKDGVQRENSLIAQNLMIAGFLSGDGRDGGWVIDPLSAGTIYVVNVYGKMMRELILK